MPKTAKVAADYTLPLYMNGLSGRMLHMRPPKGKKRELLYVYGHHTSLERYFGVAEVINKVSGVTMPDLPGFGGMESFYKIGEKPTLDNMADYLASFIKLRYKNKRFSIAGFSLGFMIVTRMLQKYPEIVDKVDYVFSIAGLVHKDDFRFKRRTFLMFRWGSSILTHRLSAGFVRYALFNAPALRLGYKIFEPMFIKDDHTKIRGAIEDEKRQRIEFEIGLWQCNDVRTYFSMSVTMLTLDLTRSHVNLPVYHVSMDNDRYFDGLKVEEHMRQIYKDFNLIKVKVPAHAPTVIATASEAAPFIPPSLRRLLNKED